MLKMNNISKYFPGVKALDDVSFSVEQGAIHGLVGENGAGKSTLMKILSGAYSYDCGEIIVDGEVIEDATPALMIEKGVAVIYQELMLLSHRTVAENIYLGRYPKNKFGKIDYNKMYEDADKVIKELKLNLDPKAYITDLSVAKRQMVEIAKAMSRNAKIIVLDEPTAAIGDSELEGLFSLIKKLSKEGVTFIYISHRLQEIFDLCTSLTILKDGQVVENGIVSDYDEDKLISKMVGREVTDIYPERDNYACGSEEILRVEGLTRKGVNNVSFDVKRGEIFGIAGLAGAGRTEIIRSIIGADPVESGKIFYKGEEVHFKSARDGIEAGIGIVPEERKSQGLLLKQDTTYNVSLASLKKVSNNFGKINLKQERKTAEEYIDLFHVRPGNPDLVVSAMSGGNQQKVVISKWLASECSLLLVDEPTRGVDVGAKQEIYTIINGLVERGMAVIMVSSELPELLGMCDRIMVMKDGVVVEEGETESVMSEPKHEYTKTLIETSFL